MDCRRCGQPLERPGDFCLACETANADVVAVRAHRDRATVAAALDGDVVSERVVTTTPEEEPDQARRELRSFAGLIADEIHRKRPERVYADGDRAVLRALRAQTSYPLEAAGGAALDELLAGDGAAGLPVADADPSDKFGGQHTTLIGETAGADALRAIAENPHVKKIVPGPIDAGGTGSQSGLRAKVTRADGNGNVRLLLRDGSSVQEKRIVTTAMDRETGERVRDDLNDALAAADLQ